MPGGTHSGRWIRSPRERVYKGIGAETLGGPWGTPAFKWPEEGWEGD